MQPTKICSKCGGGLDIEKFAFLHPAKQDGKRRPDCKVCVSKRTQRYLSDPENRRKHNERMVRVKKKAIAASKKFVLEYLMVHPCLDCGESDTVVLDFDHVTGKKIKDVSYMSNNGFRLWRIKAEIEKCEVRCANCHRRVTIKRCSRSKGWRS